MLTSVPLATSGHSLDATRRITNSSRAVTLEGEVAPTAWCAAPPIDGAEPMEATGPSPPAAAAANAMSKSSLSCSNGNHRPLGPAEDSAAAEGVPLSATPSSSGHAAHGHDSSTCR